ncbi:MAG TPA: pilus assembly protein N-terminal domain-containing protein [Myxococcaceae bacterium]|nr:pilus assembly protein N-terminal domain-containing protein [Myxococcaceae bacterium]
MRRQLERHTLLAAGALAVAAVLFGSTPALAQDQTVALGVGQNKTISIPGVRRLAPGNENVLRVQHLGGSQVLLTGVSEGRTTLIAFRASGQQITYNIVVRQQDPNEVMSEIKRLLGDIEGVTVRLVGDRIYLDGQAYTTTDANRIEEVVELYPNVKSFVKIAPNAKRLVAQNLNAAFQKAGLRNVQANVVGSTIFLEGSVESEKDLEKAEMMLKAMGERVENLLTVGIKRMILSQVQFVEIRRNNDDNYGIRYPLDIAGNITASAEIGRVFLGGSRSTGEWRLEGIGGSSFSIGLQANTGYGRLLAQPQLVCASGEEAEFLAGGEIPIPLITQNQFTVEFKKYGILLNLKPTADRDGNIQTEIEAEASEIDNSVSVSLGGNVGVPGFRTRRVKTNVTVRHGETIVLSGVFSHDEQKDVSKIPGIGHLPIVGEFFKSRGFLATKRELVIFVTPRIVNPDSDKIRTIIEDIKSRYKQAKSEVGFNIFD